LPWTILFNADVLREEVMEMGFSVTRRKVDGSSGGPRGKAGNRSDGVLSQAARGPHGKASSSSGIQSGVESSCHIRF
jgi:hypothetical protein